ncbi:interleukin-12 subunit alpha-like [Melozone crissalis]|uniref:interleukin-12 subunit alpha-like n=1 Tax=Melozone crissalis TaxID=40204 RepID=UPI0023DBA108|nr:interleukin-12 subunit alpha-like [Melozone crissalis]
MERGGSGENGMERTGNGTGSGTGKNSGNGSGSGQAAPPGGRGRALLCLALLLLLPPARALPSAVRALTSTDRALTSTDRALTDPKRCLNRSRQLLEAANAAPQRLKESNTLGFECTLEEVDLHDITENQTNTLRACTAADPGPGNCPVLEKSTFDEGKCLQGISEDVRAYRAQLRSLPDPQLLAALDGMMEALGSSTGQVLEAPLASGPSGLGSMGSSGPSGSSGLGSMGSSGPLGPWGSLGSAPFAARLRLCATLQALRIRSVTISRVLSFLSSP